MAVARYIRKAGGRRRYTKKALKTISKRLRKLEIANKMGWEVVEEMRSSSGISGSWKFQKKLAEARKAAEEKKKAQRGKHANWRPLATGPQPFRGGPREQNRSLMGPCYQCGEKGHIAKFCPQRKGQATEHIPQHPSGNAQQRQKL